MSDEALAALLLSFRVALLATAVASVSGVACARLLARAQFPGKEMLEAVLLLPLVLPPTVVGFGLLLLLGRKGPLAWVFPGQVLFTWWAAVIASAVVAFPLMYQNAKAAFESVDINQERAARTLGAGEMRVFFTVSLPLAWPGIMAGLVLAFARALGEFGATLMVAGNIPGQTQTAPMAIYFAVEAGDYRTAVPLVAIVLLFSFAVIFWLNWWSRNKVAPYALRRRG